MAQVSCRFLSWFCGSLRKKHKYCCLSCRRENEFFAGLVLTAIVTVKPPCQDKTFSSDTCTVSLVVIPQLLFYPASSIVFTGWCSRKKFKQLSCLKGKSTTIKCLNVTKINCVKLNSVFNLEWFLWSLRWEWYQQKWLFSSLAARWGFIKGWLFSHALGFINGTPAKLGRPSLIFVWSIFLGEHFFQLELLPLSCWS